MTERRHMKPKVNDEKDKKIPFSTLVTKLWKEEKIVFTIKYDIYRDIYDEMNERCLKQYDTKVNIR